MKRIFSVLTRPELAESAGDSYLFLTKEGIYAGNSQTGLHFKHTDPNGKFAMSTHLGEYAVIDPFKFINAMGTLIKEKIESVTPIFEQGENMGKLEVKMTRKKGVMEFSIEKLSKEDRQKFDVFSYTYHKFVDEENIEEEASRRSNSEYVPLLPHMGEMYRMLSSDAEAQWGDRSGVYVKDGVLFSFDNGVIMTCEDIPELKGKTDLFLSKKLLKIGFDDLRDIFVDKENRNLTLVGPRAQVSSVINEHEDNIMEHIENVLSIKDSFNSPDTPKADLELDIEGSFWKRLKVLSPSTNLKVKFVKSENKENFYDMMASAADGLSKWQEYIGRINGVKEGEITINTNIFQRWVELKLDRQIGIGSDGNLYLYGKTGSGVKFYGLIRDLTSESFNLDDEDTGFFEDGGLFNNEFQSESSDQSQELTDTEVNNVEHLSNL